ncbi:putative N-acetylated-alpha-linked acidic dipeptidase isoform X2 [Styela clava]
MKEPHRIVLFAVIACGIGIGVGVIIGYFSHDTSIPEPKADPDASQRIMDEIKAENIEAYLRVLTENPHIAGRSVDEEDLVNYITNEWEKVGVKVEIHPYDVLLSYPDEADSNILSIKMADGTLVNQSHPKEAILDQSQDKPGVVNPFNAYSASGDIEADLVYVNYGTIEDFLNISKIIDLDEKICIARYGKIFRGDKVTHAEQYNCSGLILYSDPKDYAVKGRGVYPNDWYLPGTGAQRGTVKQADGDSLTPFYPSIGTAWYRNETKSELPKIPVTPIGYDDAIMYLEKLGGEEVPTNWRGGMNITYRYGPGFAGEFSTSMMKMHVTTKNQMATTKNVIGYIRGSVEPDRYVIIGNHRDAWVFGSIDPSSGTATLLEMVRSFGQAVKQGWRPRRTLVFCSWGAEEYGLIGSTEWVEEFVKVLGSRSIAYLNVDAAVTGNYTIRVSGSSSMKQVSFDAAKTVSNPNQNEIANGRKSTYDTWLHTSDGDEPRFVHVGSGSDFATFLQLPGIAVLDFEYEFDTVALEISGYPVYHSVYETFEYMKAFVDPDFSCHQATARVVAEIARQLVDSPIIPFNVVDYANSIASDKDTMLFYYGSMMEENAIDTGILDEAVANLTTAARSLHNRIDGIDITDALAVRSVNDQLMQLERAFIDKQGITGRSEKSHVLYAPNLHNTYGSSAFPGLVDSMFEIDSDANQKDRWNEVRRQYSILLYHIGSAASTLRDVTPIKGYSNQ